MASRTVSLRPGVVWSASRNHEPVTTTRFLHFPPCGRIGRNDMDGGRVRGSSVPAETTAVPRLDQCRRVTGFGGDVDNIAASVDKRGQLWTSRWIRRDISGKPVCKADLSCGGNVDCHRWFSTIHTCTGELWIACPPTVRSRSPLQAEGIEGCPHYPQPLLLIRSFSIYS